MNKLKLLAAAIMLGTSTLTLVGCVESPTTDNSESASSFELSTNAVSMTQIGETATVNALLDGEVVNTTITLSTNDYLTVSGNTFTAKAEGRTTISFSYEDFELYCVVNVDTSFAITYEIEKTSNVKSNDEFNIGASVTLPDVSITETGITYTSSDTDIATVDEEGNVTAISAGFAVISMVSVATVWEDGYEIMGQTVPGSYKNTSASINILVDNEFSSTTAEELIGTYEASYDWVGFGETSAATSITEAGWIRALLSLDINEDGTFKQVLYNAQRSNYSLVDGVITNGHTYNRYNQSTSLDIAKDFTYNDGEGGQTVSLSFADVFGYTTIPHFTESGHVYMSNNVVTLYYTTTKGETKSFVVGAISDLTSNGYSVFENQTTFHANMHSMILTKVVE